MRISITAGAHADEPAGPRTAVWIAEHIAQGVIPWARELKERCTFTIVPHVNPDGDAANAKWQSNPLEFEVYLRHVQREGPPEDVEFHYPKDESDRDTRPENLAAADFLRANGPFDLHMSLHSMGVAEGAWFLICREWRDRAVAAGVTQRLANHAGRNGLPLHDMERHGEKGFTRIAPGFCTTPRSDAMREYFLERDDPETAAHFRPSSMEFVQSLGGDPLCLVSELPHFLIGTAIDSPAPLTARPYHALREELPGLRAAAQKREHRTVRRAMDAFDIRPVPWPVQRALQLEFLMEGVRLVAAGRAQESS
jgi:hypothetical protein